MAWTITLTDADNGDRSSHTFERLTVVLGRDPSTDLVIKDKMISRRHLALTVGADGPQVEDTSRNGTYVKEPGGWARLDGERWFEGEITLKLGRFEVDVHYADATPAEPDDPEQTWDESVIISADKLATMREAILVFDLCESSAIANRDDHMAYHLKQRLTQIADPVLSAENRRFFKSTGDGFLACFPEPRNALNAALELERRIQHRNSRTSNAPINYRIALHFGETWLISAGGDDIHGNDVNITFRIEGVQQTAFDHLEHPFPARDRIMCSGAFVKSFIDKYGESMPGDYLPCGSAKLKGISAPTDIFLVLTDFTSQEAQAS